MDVNVCIRLDVPRQGHIYSDIVMNKIKDFKDIYLAWNININDKSTYNIHVYVRWCGMYSSYNVHERTHLRLFLLILHSPAL